MDKNFLFAILLSTLVIIIYASPQYQRRFGREAQRQETTLDTANSLNASRVRTTAPENTLSSPASVLPDSRSIDQSVLSESTDSELTVSESGYAQINIPENAGLASIENDNLKIVIDSRGGIIREVILKEFDGSSPGTPVQLITESQTWYNGGIEVEESFLPFDGFIFSITSSSLSEMKLTADIENGLGITRSFSLKNQGYILNASTELDGPWNEATIVYSWHGPVNETEVPYRELKIWPFSMLMKDDRITYQKLVYLGDGTRTTVINGDEKTKQGGKRIFPKEDHSQRIDASKRGNGSDMFVGNLDWYAVRNKYFISIAIPSEKERWSASSVYSNTGDRKWFDFSLSKRNIDGDSSLDMYLGPISYYTLKEYGSDLTEAMELSYRFIRPLSIAFLWVFNKLQKFIPNWGLVIIVFAILIKIVLHPLSKTSYDSMSRMSALQPQINELKIKYKNNPQMMQKATMELYKKEGVNPFSGCLPMLLQMPVFFALFPVVGRAFELRQAMFVPYWIEDLSRPDPFYILPIAMGISMFFQSKSTMKDPNQKPMLYMMPVMMVIFLVNFSAGLSLYWFVFNIATLLQQKYHRSK